MNDKLKILHVVPTLKKDGAEVQLAELFKEIDNVRIELFTFDLYENGDSISNSLENITIYNESSIKSIFFLNKIIKNNNYLSNLYILSKKYGASNETQFLFFLGILVFLLLVFSLIFKTIVRFKIKI